MKLYIKNMVSIRCKMVVKAVLKKLKLKYAKVDLGVIEMLEPITPEQGEKLKFALQKCGLELLADKKSILTEQIKSAIVEMVHYDDAPLKMNFSAFLSKKLHYHYTYLSNIFSQVSGTTIERFIIAHKIERIKQLIFYDEMSLTEIAFLLNYSSVAHLSNQFKKMTGQTPSNFKRLQYKCIYGLDEVNTFLQNNQVHTS